MSKSIRALAAVLFVATAATAWADDKDAIALQLQLNKRVEAKAATRPIPYADAVKLAAKTGKPIFVAVASDCKSICGELRPDFLTCHEKEFAGSAKPRYILAIPSKTEPKGFIHLEWNREPKVSDIKAEAAKYKVSRAAELNDAGDLLAMIALGTIAIDATDSIEWVESPRVICDANGCRVVDGVTYTRLPVGDGPALTSAPVADAAAFVPRFPRVARLRGKVRQSLGMRPPQVAGAFVPVQSVATVTVTTTTTSSEPNVVGGPILNRLLVRPLLRDACRDALASGKLTPDQAKMASRILGEREIAELATTLTHERAKSKLVGGPVIDSLKAWLVANLPAILDALLKLLMGLL